MEEAERTRVMQQFSLFSPMIGDEEREAANKVLQGRVLTRGPVVQQFEKELARYLDVSEVVCFDNATNALNLVYKALKPESSGRLLTTPITFASTATAGLMNGFTLELLDSDPFLLSTGNLIPDIGDNDIFVPMHYGGYVKSISPQINEKAIVVEDACHAFGSYDLQGNKVGSCKNSRAAVFSFHPAKNITTLEGGAVSTHDKDLAEKLRELRHNGIRRNPLTKNLSYDVIEPSFNAHMNEVSAAIGLEQLKKIDGFKKKRFELMNVYAEFFNTIPGMHFEAPYESSCHHLAAVLIDFSGHQANREEVMRYLKANGVSSNVHYIPLYEFSFFEGAGAEKYSLSDTFYQQTLSLPLHVGLTADDVQKVMQTLMVAIKNSR